MQFLKLLKQVNPFKKSTLSTTTYTKLSLKVKLHLLAFSESNFTSSRDNKGRFTYVFIYSEGGGRNFERPNVERPIFRNLKSWKLREVQLFDFLIYEIIILFIYFAVIWTLKFGILNFHAPIFL